MKRIFFSLILLFSVQISFANLLYDIVDGKFKVKDLVVPYSMKDGENYTLMVNKKAIVKFNYKTGAVIDTLFSVSRLQNAPFKEIEGYEFSPNEAKLLVRTNVKKRYRRTFIADYYLYDIKRNEIQPLSEYGPQESPLFSPDSRYVAFARNNNLYLKKLDFNTESAITKDGEKNKIINGVPDWLYEEEFGVVRCFEWSPDSKLLAFIKFDETEVPEFSYQLYADSTKMIDGLSLYPTTVTYKYPKAGQNISKVSVCIFDERQKSIRTIELNTLEKNFYIPRIKWTSSVDQLAIFTLNRNQNEMKMFLANPKSTLSKLILQEKDDNYIDYRNFDFFQFSSDNQYFIGVSEKDGYRHVYQYQINGTLIKQLTAGNWDVTDVYGFDENTQTLYYQSAETSPLQRDVYAITTKGKKTRLTDGKGVHQAIFNSNFTYFVDNASSLENANTLTVCNNKGNFIRVFQNNDSITQEWEKLNLPKKEFFSFTTSENIKLNGWILKPSNFDTTKKYPLLLVQYSGPDAQEVLDEWNVDWEYYLATQNYVVACVDGRGTGARGVKFRKCTYQQLGILETKDQIETAKFLSSQHYIDNERIGIWGWSYGGFITLMAMSSPEKIFKTGIAVAPVTDWRLYNAAYTERYMRRPQENFKGYDLTSPLLHATHLNGNLLIIHGTADDNVHAQNTLLYAQHLEENNKKFQMLLYTDKNHSILGKETRRHLYQQMSEFLFMNL
ncbi:MAG TPA: S9 family peptidase [Paludibacteraceae bacterium]|nr:S9 family peptidase [Paludibacteraceae bacterium]HOL00083.1 S9 family peptidase [Paludibacteraceae bacterium]